MQIRWELASNKQNNILFKNHQGTRCFDTRTSAGAPEESEECSQLLRSLKVYSFAFWSVSTQTEAASHFYYNMTTEKKCMGRRLFIILKSFASIVSSQYNSFNIFNNIHFQVSKLAIKKIPSEVWVPESISHCIHILERKFEICPSPSFAQI